MRIALFDLVHSSYGITTNTVPLAAGLLATYLKKYAASKHEIKIYKNSLTAISELERWKPHIIGLSQYAWNTRLNLHVAAILRRENPNIAVIIGGPNQEISISRRIAILRRNPIIDLCVIHDGELPLLQIVNRLDAGEGIQSIKEQLPAGVYCLTKGVYNESPLPAPRIDSLDVFGSIYAEGIFDEFLDLGQLPFVQTHRGCPFSCEFCHASDPYMSKVLFLSPDIFSKDMETLGKRFAGREEITLYIANTNMSLFERDFPIAEIIKATQIKYGWPKYLNINSGKDPKRLLEMLNIINFEPGIALQTLTPSVLHNIKRKNIPFEAYVQFQRDILRKTGVPSATELIMSLPGETKNSFLDTLRKVLNSGVQNIVVLTFMNLKGTPTSSDEIANKFGHIIRSRVVPRQYSIINSDKIFDTEEVIVGTKFMSMEDYFDIRALYFTITVFFNSAEFIPIKRFLIESKADLADWIFNIHNRRFEFPEIEWYHNEFVRETKEELFDSHDSIVHFYGDPQHFEELTQGKRGDNLSRKYKYLTLFNCYSSCLNLAIKECERLVSSSTSPDFPNILINLKKYLSQRNLRSFFDEKCIDSELEVTLDYDIPRWLAEDENEQTLQNFNGKCTYLVGHDQNQRIMFEEAIKTYKDLDLSMQILYRDGMIKDYWCRWKYKQGVSG